MQGTRTQTMLLLFFSFLFLNIPTFFFVQSYNSSIFAACVF